MMVLARMGDLNSAFTLANGLYPSRRGANAEATDRIWLDNPAPNDTAFLASTGAAPLRRDPRFLALADRTGLLAYWRSGRLPDFCTKAHEPECGAIERS
jgi:hypothetical protein